jgi:short-subunit dehydrogenase
MNVLVTGAGSGLGLEVSKALQKAGHTVIRHSRSSGDFDLTGDLSDTEFLDSISKSLEKFKIDAVIHSAGTYLGGKLSEAQDLEIQDAILSNLTSSALFLKRISIHFRKQRNSQLVVINSIASLNPNKLEPVYGACKAALHYLTQAIQLDLLDSGTRVAEVFPGAMNTPMTIHREDQEKLMDPADVAEIICRILDEGSTAAISSVVIRNKR